jgi:nicotinate-nucleotide pyrophosphorylase (carboxylating)
MRPKPKTGRLESPACTSSLSADATAKTVARALAEDVGTGDITTLTTVSPQAQARATITQKQEGVIFGIGVATAVFLTVDRELDLEVIATEAVWSKHGTTVLRIEGTAAAILAAERTALNFLQHLSGVATTTRRYVDAVSGTAVRILDTRKTTPGLRSLEKAAVIAGGGTAHRFGLFDAVLIKENHAALAGGVGAAVRRVRARLPDAPLVVECRTRGEVLEALAAGAPRLLLDNMSTSQLREIVREVNGRAVLEASGGVTLDTVRTIAETGVDLVSVGALTHSAPALDLSLTLEPFR